MDDLQERVGRIDTLIGRIDESAAGGVREHVRELVDTLLAVHGSAMERLIDAVYSEGGQEAVDAVADDDLVGSLLLLHGLHPLPREARISRALEDVRPYLHSHGGNVEMVGVTEDGKLHVRLEGSCDGCPSSSATLKYAIEEAVYKAAPDIVAIEVVDPPKTGDNGDAASVVSGGRSDENGEFIPMAALTADVTWDDCPFPTD